MPEPSHHVCESCEAHLYCPNAGKDLSPCPGCLFYTLGIFFLADDDDKATGEHDVDPIFCNANCATTWLVDNTRDVVEDVY